MIVDSIWNSFLKPFWKRVSQTCTSIHKNVFRPIWNFNKSVCRYVVKVVKATDRTVTNTVTRVTTGLKKFSTSVYNLFKPYFVASFKRVKSVIAFVSRTWTKFSNGFSFIYRRFLLRAWILTIEELKSLIYILRAVKYIVKEYVLTPAWNAVKSVYRTFASFVKEVYHSFANTVKSYINTIKLFFEWIYRGLCKISQVLNRTARSIRRRIGSVTSKLVRLIESFGKLVHKWVLLPVWNTIKSVNSSVVRVVTNIPDYIANGVNKLQTSTYKYVISPTMRFTKLVARAIDRHVARPIDKAVTWVLNSATNFVTNTKKFIHDDVLDPIYNGAKWVATSIKNVTKKALRVTSRRIKFAAKGVWRFTVKTAKSIRSAIESLYNGFVNNVTTPIWNATKSLGTGIKNHVFLPIGRSVKWSVKKVSSAVRWVNDQIWNGIEKIKSAFSSLVNRVTERIRSLYHQLIELFIQRVRNPIQSAINSFFSALWRAVRRGATTIKTDVLAPLWRHVKWLWETKISRALSSVAKRVATGLGKVLTALGDVIDRYFDYVDRAINFVTTRYR